MYLTLMKVKKIWSLLQATTVVKMSLRYPAKSPDIELTDRNSQQSISNISRVCILWNKAFQEHTSLHAQSKGKKK